MPTEDAVDIQLKSSTVPVIANLTSASRYVQTYFLSTDSFGSRRPIPDNDKTVVIQPGSRFLKIGFAKDAFPKIIPHVIAYKSNAMDLDTDHQDYDEEEWELGEDELKEHLAARHKSLKRKPPPNVYQSLISYNRSVEPQQISQHNDAFTFDWTECPAGQPFFVGKEALRLDPAEGYALRWPIRRGTIDRLLYHSYREAIGDMDRIWSHIFRNQLAIKGPLGSYSAMIVLPGDVSRWEIRAYTELALNLLGMGSVSFILEPVAATFGAGVSGACVVDLGAQCISVGCVEEGLLLPDALVKLDYGGDDLTRLLHNILKHHNFPYQIPLGLKDPLDFELLNDLRVNLCTLDEEDVGVGAQVYEFFVRRPGKTTLQYHFKVFEERMLPILAMFEEGAPWLNAFEAAKRKRLEQATFYTGSFELETELQKDGETNPKAIAEDIDEDGAPQDSQLPAVLTASNIDLTAAEQLWPCSWKGCIAEPFTVIPDLVEHLRETHASASQCCWNGCSADLTVFSGPSAFFHLVDHINGSMGNKNVENTGFAHEEPAAKPQQQDSLVSAILKSAQQASSSLRLLSSILLVGGTSQTPHLQTFLRSALSQAILEAAPPNSDPVVIDFIPNTRDLDPSFVSWKGGAVASKLEGCQDAWIHADEWLNWGPKIFREKLPFSW